jgi:hypothetical protein
MNWLTLAPALDRPEQAEESRKWREQTARWLAEKRREAAQSGWKDAPGMPHWVDWLSARLLLAEAGKRRRAEEEER